MSTSLDTHGVRIIRSERKNKVLTQIGAKHGRQRSRQNFLGIGPQHRSRQGFSCGSILDQHNAPGLDVEGRGGTGVVHVYHERDAPIEARPGQARCGGEKQRRAIERADTQVLSFLRVYTTEIRQVPSNPAGRAARVYIVI